MKTIIFFLFTAMWTLPSFGKPLIQVDSPHIQALSTKAILAKYPDVKRDDLVFSDIQYSLSAKGEEQIRVTYDLTNTTKITVDGDWITKKTKTTSVILSRAGKIESFSGGQFTSSSTTNMPPNTALKPTPTAP